MTCYTLISKKENLTLSYIIVQVSNDVEETQRGRFFNFIEKKTQSNVSFLHPKTPDGTYMCTIHQPPNTFVRVYNATHISDQFFLFLIRSRAYYFACPINTIGYVTISFLYVLPIYINICL